MTADLAVDQTPRVTHPWQGLLLIDHLDLHQRRLMLYSELFGQLTTGRLELDPAEADALVGLLNEEALRAVAIEQLVKEQGANAFEPEKDRWPS